GGAGDDTQPKPDIKRPLGFAAGGLGLAGVAVGAITGIMASSKFSGAKNDPATCRDNFCNPTTGHDAIQASRNLATVSTIGFVAGGVALAAGVTLVLVSSPGKKKEPAASAGLVPAAGPQGGGLSFIGSF